MIEKAEHRRRRRYRAAAASGALAAVSETEPQVALFLDTNDVAAVIKLRGYDDTYLYVARPLDPRVIAQLQATQASVARVSPTWSSAASACRSRSR